MRMLSAPVLLGAVLASSPALYQGFVTQTVPLEQAGGRFAVALVLAWIAISAVAMLVGEPPKPVVEPVEEDPTLVMPGIESGAEESAQPA